jgi:predicted component of type VI protein secretion system
MPRGTVATLEIVGGGLLRGQRYAITTVLAHLGRGEHNEVVIPEESVSDSHAKLQRRDGTWYVTDLASTNGTYVAGRRIDAEERLGSTAEVRVGGVKLAFAAVATEPSTEPRGATRDFSALHVGEPPWRPAAAADRVAGGAAAARPRAATESEPSSAHRAPAAAGPVRTRWVWLLLGVAAAAGAAVYLIKGR